jgi:hypothetical protein
VESLQLQVAPTPMDIEENPGSSPSVEQPPLDLNMPAQDNEMEKLDPSINLSPSN